MARDQAPPMLWLLVKDVYFHLGVRLLMERTAAWVFVSFCIFVKEWGVSKHCREFRLRDFVVFKGMNSFFEGEVGEKIFLSVLLKLQFNFEKNIKQI